MEHLCDVHNSEFLDAISSKYISYWTGTAWNKIISSTYMVAGNLNNKVQIW